jgi:hypothetical protein
MASFLYYRCDESVMPDEDFDALCKDLIAEQKDIRLEFYAERNNFNIGELEAGTGFHLKYRLMDAMGACHWFKTLHGRDVNKFDYGQGAGDFIEKEKPVLEKEEFDFL